MFTYSAADTFREMRRLRSYIAFLNAVWFASGRARNDALAANIDKLRALRAKARGESR